MTPEEKAWIDNASYEELLRKWRMEPAGSPWFQGSTGSYYAEVLSLKRHEVGNTEHVRISKKIGWERG